ncbi:MAG TPA: cation diffusion facilitator family transporter [Methanolinea sp.]|nr:cation diffusion facilitator family transporter [Methanolinea sp.]
MGENQKNDISLVKQALILTVIFLTIEAIGGYLSGSLSLISDAFHMLSDVSALLLTFGALRLGQTLPSKERTFGYHRVETTTAFANACILVLIGLWILWEAFQRISAPPPIQVSLMLPVAFIGLIVNLYIALRLHGSHDLSVKSAYLHILADTLSSAAVILAGIWIMVTGEMWVDPVLSLLLSVFIIGSALPVIRESGAILLQFAPRDIDFSALIADIESIPGVGGVHNVHVWSLCSHTNVLDAHIFTCVENMADQEVIKQEIKQRLEKYRVYHSTLEFECNECKDCSVVQPFKDPHNSTKGRNGKGH